ncbi:MAG: hypothetical protein ACREI8_12705, partial [Myxococcota bacterium]
MPCTKAMEIDFEAFVVDPRALEWTEFRDHYPRCPDCSREVARLGALVAALRLEGRGASAHPTSQQLVTLSTSPEQLRPEDRRGIEGHLAGCAPCRTEFAVLTSFEWSAVSAPRRGPSWLERLGASLFPALPRPVLAALLLVLLAVPALFIWRTLSDRATDEPRQARIETKTEASPVPKEEPKQAEGLLAESPAPAPEPRKIAKPVEP